MHEGRVIPEVNLLDELFFCPYCGKKLIDEKSFENLSMETCPHLVYAAGSDDSCIFWAVRSDFAHRFIEKFIETEDYIENIDGSEKEPLSDEFQEAFVKASFDLSSGKSVTYRNDYKDNYYDLYDYGCGCPHKSFPELLAPEACLFVIQSYHSAFYIALDHGAQQTILP